MLEHVTNIIVFAVVVICLIYLASLVYRCRVIKRSCDKAGKVDYVVYQGEEIDESTLSYSEPEEAERFMYEKVMMNVNGKPMYFWRLKNNG